MEQDDCAHLLAEPAEALDVQLADHQAVRDDVDVVPAPPEVRSWHPERTCGEAENPEHPENSETYMRACISDG